MMDINIFPTKGNLIAAENTLKISREGYELLDRKRNILIKEIMELSSTAAIIQSEIEAIFGSAYEALQRANVEIGTEDVKAVSFIFPEDTSIEVKTRSVMGTEVPKVTKSVGKSRYNVDLLNTFALDNAVTEFEKVKELILKLAYIENAAYRLAMNIKKTQKRANALKNITIPKYENMTKYMRSVLEENQRDEFTRLKVIKRH